MPTSSVPAGKLTLAYVNERICMQKHMLINYSHKADPNQ